MFAAESTQPEKVTLEVSGGEQLTEYNVFRVNADETKPVLSLPSDCWFASITTQESGDGTEFDCNPGSFDFYCALVGHQIGTKQPVTVLGECTGIIGATT